MHTKTAPGISVLLPTKDRAAFLEKAVRSVLAQTHRPLEIVISDNCSTDETPDVIRALTERFAAAPEEGVVVRGFRQPVDRGHIANHLFAYEQASHRYCYFLHDDDYLVDPAFFAEAVAVMERTPSCFLAIGNTRVTRLDPATGAETVLGNVLNIPQYSTEGFTLYDGSALVFTFGNRYGWPCYGSIVFNREFAQTTGAFRPPFVIGQRESEQYGLSQEEGLCFLFLLAVGNRVAYANRPVVCKTSHPGRIALTPELKGKAYAGSLYMYKKACEYLIRQRRGSVAALLRWYAGMVLFKVRIRYTPAIFASLFRLMPAVTILHFGSQTVRYGTSKLFARLSQAAPSQS